MDIAVVLVGGDIPDSRLLEGIVDATLVIAADSGVRIARTHGLPVHVLIGDLDSASPGDRAWAEAEGAEIVEFSSDKDATDLELALDHADAAGVDRIIAVGIEGGRLDHELGNWAVLTRKRASVVEIRGATGNAIVLHGDGHNSLEMEGKQGDVVSLLAQVGDAQGVSTTGLRWTLDDAVLQAGSTRGVSNEFVEETASVSLSDGTLLVIRPVV